MKSFTIVGCLLLAFLTGLQAKNISYLEYIEKFYPIAVSEMHRTSIPASIKLAQGILESNAGRSTLATESNNHFGIKCGGDWKGKKNFREDDDYRNGKLIKSCFRQFDSAQESYYAHSQFLRDPAKAHRYGFLFDYSSQDYKSWAKGLLRAGYATNPKYASLLINIIEVYELWQYDTPVYEDMKPSLASTKFTYQVNGAQVIEALGGDTPNSIADRTGISLNKVLKNNKELHFPGQNINQGYRVYLQPKRKKSFDKKKLHIVRIDESIFDISQNYGISESSLREMNRMNRYEEAKPGEHVYLRGKRPRNKRLKTIKRPVNKPKAPSKTKPAILVETKKEPNRMDNHFAGVSGEHLDFIITPQADLGEPTYVRTKGNTEHNVNVNIKIEQVALDKPEALKPEVQSGQAVRKKSVAYVVVQGDTLYKISRMHGVSISQIKLLNGIENDQIIVGQNLKIK